MSKGKELVVTSPSQYMVANLDMSVKGIIEANLGEGAQIRAFDLDQLKVPSQGAVFWNYEDIDGEQSAKEILGVIVAIVNTRAYYEKSFQESGGGDPPSCSSFDLLHGDAEDPDKMRELTEGKWTGDCTNCPFSEWGTAVNDDGTPGAGQACAERKFIFLVMEKGALPFVVNVPTGSLKNVQQYLLRLTSNMVKPHQRVTKFTLEPATSRGKGIKFSKIKMSVAGPVDNPDFWENYINGIRSIVTATAQRLTKEQQPEE